MTSSAASSEDFELRGMWFRMWSSISSAMRLLMAPRAAERRCKTSAQGSSAWRARRALSSWPMIFLVRLTRSSFSHEVCDICLIYPIGVWYQGSRLGASAFNNSGKMGMRAPTASHCRARGSSFIHQPRFSLHRSNCEPELGGAKGKLEVEDAAFGFTFRFGALRHVWRFFVRGFGRARTRFASG